MFILFIGKNFHPLRHCNLFLGITERKIEPPLIKMLCHKSSEHKIGKVLGVNKLNPLTYNALFHLLERIKQERLLSFLNYSSVFFSFSRNCFAHDLISEGHFSPFHCILFYFHLLCIFVGVFITFFVYPY